MRNGPGRRSRRDTSRPQHAAKRSARTSRRPAAEAGPAAGHPKDRRTIRTLVSGRGLATIAPKGSLLRPLAALAVVVVVIALVLATPLRQYLAQRQELAAVHAQERQLRDQLAELQQRRDALRDPDYVKAQARRHLQYVAPGETVYRIVAPLVPDTKPALPSAKPTVTWYTQMWSTLLHQEIGPTPTPGTGGPPGTAPDTHQPSAPSMTNGASDIDTAPPTREGSR